MFEKLAKFRSFESRDVTRRAATHCNDNLPGFRRPERRRPTPALACHWVPTGRHLECRWTIEDAGEASADDLDRQRRAGRASDPRAAIARLAAVKMTASA